MVILMTGLSFTTIAGVSIDLRNYYLSDDIANLAKWQLPGVGIDPSGYTLFWIDNESEEGDMHANFKTVSIRRIPISLNQIR